MKRLSTFFVTIEKGDLKAMPIFFHLLLVSLPFINFFSIFFLCNKSELKESTTMLMNPMRTPSIQLASSVNVVYLDMTGFHFSHAVQLSGHCWISLDK